MENNHTQGEWAAKGGQVYCTETGNTLAVIPHYDNEERQDADARLMASAPELLEALKNLMEAEGGEAGENPDQQQAWRDAEHVIQKATQP